MPTTKQSTWTLRRSCSACARGKKRCDLLLPTCSRCQLKALRCAYVNEPARPDNATKSERPLEQVAPKPLATVDEHQGDVSGCLPDQTVVALLRYSGPTTVRPSFYGVPLTLDAQTAEYIVMHLASLPAMFANRGTTPFINLVVYGQGLPESIEDIWSVCISASSGSSSNKFLTARMLDTKTNKIIRSAKANISYAHLLAAVQGLIMATIIRLFVYNDMKEDGNGLQDDALLDMLSNLTFRLWQQAPPHLSTNINPCQAWLFAESVRRTILFSNILCMTCAVMRQGYFLHTPFIEALPFDIRTSLWNMLSSSYGEDNTGQQITNIGTKMVSYREYVDMWEFGQVHGSTAFGILLLVTCMGKDVVKKGIPASFLEKDG